MKRFIFIFSMLFSTLTFAEETKPVRVYVDVVGDLFHAGHVQFFQKAREYGDYLVVGIHGDEEVTDYKRRPILTLEERKIVIEACRYVDEVILNSPIGISKEWIEEHELDVVIHGDDYDMDRILEQYSPAVEMGIFRTVPYTEGISTSEIIDRIKERY